MRYYWYIHKLTHTHNTVTRSSFTQPSWLAPSPFFPAFPISISHLLGDHWKKLTCRVIRSFNFVFLGKAWVRMEVVECSEWWGGREVPATNLYNCFLWFCFFGFSGPPLVSCGRLFLGHLQSTIFGVGLWRPNQAKRLCLTAVKRANRSRDAQSSTFATHNAMEIEIHLKQEIFWDVDWWREIG